VTQASQLADDVPQYAADVREWVQGNKQLHDLDQKYNVTQELEKQAAKLPSKVGDAASTLSSLGLGLVNSIFALVNILILSIFMVGRGGAWVEAAINLRPEHERERWRRVLNHVSNAVAGYVQGALTIALIAGVATFVALTVLGVPFRAPLAVMAGLFSLIPLIGATIAAVLIGVVTLFSNFPTATIAWVVWAIVYQQIENTVIQPQVQKRTVQVPPIVVLVAVLFGSALLGVIGALVAIPVAASVMIAVREWWDWRQESRRNQIVAPDVEVPSTLITPATGDPDAPPRPA
jgi:predicted PurR-regulated permease PerM